MVAVLVISVLAVGAVEPSPEGAAFTDCAHGKTPQVTPDVCALAGAAWKLLTATPPRYADAIAGLKQADALPMLSAYEHHLINELLGFAYIHVDDCAAAATLLESGLKDGQLDEADIPKRLQTLAALNFRLKNYDKAIEFGTRAIREGYANSELDDIVGGSYYSKADWRGTRKFYDELVEGEIKRAETPTKASLLFLRSACAQLLDRACVRRTLDWQIRYHPGG